MGVDLRVGLGGSVMLGREVDRRPPEAVWGDLLDDLRSVDCLAINLESPLSDRDQKWSNSYRPFHFRASPEWARDVLLAADVDVACLANDHALDYRVEGLCDTLETLQAAGVRAVGAGENRRSAFEPATVEAGDGSVAVLAVTGHAPEYGATRSSPGVAHLRPNAGDTEVRQRITESIARARETDPDLLVASLHVGEIMRSEPAGQVRAFAQWLVEAGVDAVYGHSAHVFQGVELYDGAPICYDCGDLLTDYAVDPDLRNDRGFLFELELTEGAITSVRLRPVEIDDERVWKADPEAAAWTRERMRDRSRELGTEYRRDGADLVVDVE